MWAVVTLMTFLPLANLEVSPFTVHVMFNYNFGNTNARGRSSTSISLTAPRLIARLDQLLENIDTASCIDGSAMCVVVT